MFQKDGIPIGGPAPGAILEAVEHMFDAFGWKVFSSDLGIRGSRGQWLSLVRYVDDVFAHSFWFCQDCVVYIITLIYRNTVTFDKACEGLVDFSGFRTTKFLDQWCYSSWQKTFFALANENDLFSFSGLIYHKCKNRFPIPYGDRVMLVRRITCDIQSRLAKFAQNRASKNEVYYHTIIDFSELLRLGYSYKLLNGMYIFLLGISVLVVVRCLLKLSILLACLQAWCDWILAGAVFGGIGSMVCNLLNLAAPVVSPVTSILYMLPSSHSPPAAVITTAVPQPIGNPLDPTFGTAGLVSLPSVFGCAYGAYQVDGP